MELRPWAFSRWVGHLCTTSAAVLYRGKADPKVFASAGCYREGTRYCVPTDYTSMRSLCKGLV